ncbi:MAG: 4Fe-4S dicluster domain-containing protein [Kiloniellales bacterium]
MPGDTPDPERRALITGAWRRPKAAPAVVRPPGARAPDAFAALCDGCGECALACPAEAIAMTGPATEKAEGSPQILALESPCIMCDGLVCSSACPVGALESATPESMRIGRVEFHADACLAAQGIDPGCDYCFDRCPLKGRAITYRRGRGPEIDAAHCTGCGTCVFFCPPLPKALEVLPEALGNS